MKDIVIIGAGDFGKEIAWLIDDINRVAMRYNLLGYIDDYKEQDIEINGYKVLGNSDYLSKVATAKKLYGIISIKNGDVRKNLVRKICNIEWETLIHPSVIISGSSKIGEGSIVAAGSIISNDVKIGKHCLINLACTIGHDNIFENYVSVMPGCNLSGFTTLKEGCFLGTGVKIIPHRTVGEASIIGAGTVIIKDIPGFSTAVGNPARIIKPLNNRS